MRLQRHGLRIAAGRWAGPAACVGVVCLPVHSHSLQVSSSVADKSLTAPAEEGLNKGLTIVRLPGNPLITPQTDASLGANINGPSLIRVPRWVAHPLGAYYLYFAAHQGKTIRLAYADKLEGPWKSYQPGTLQLAQSFFTDHIASPEVIIDAAQQQIRLYYHGLTPEDKTQHTRVALFVRRDTFHSTTGTGGPRLCLLAAVSLRGLVVRAGDAGQAVSLPGWSDRL